MEWGPQVKEDTGQHKENPIQILFLPTELH